MSWRTSMVFWTALASAFGGASAGAVSLGEAGAPGCVASYGVLSDFESAGCSYVAGGPGRYVAMTSSGVRFEIWVDGKRVINRFDGATASGTYVAEPGQIVTLRLHCGWGAYCAFHPLTVVAVGDE